MTDPVDRHTEPPKHGAVNETAQRRRVAALVECPICHGPCQEADLAPATDRHTEPDGPNKQRAAMWAAMWRQAIEESAEMWIRLSPDQQRQVLARIEASDLYSELPAQEQRT